MSMGKELGSGDREARQGEYKAGASFREPSVVSRPGSGALKANWPKGEGCWGGRHQGTGEPGSRLAKRVGEEGSNLFDFFFLSPKTLRSHLNLYLPLLRINNKHIYTD